MKKSIIILSILLFSSAVLLIFSIFYIYDLHIVIAYKLEMRPRDIIYPALLVFAFFSNITAIVMIAIKDLPVLREKLTAIKTKRTQQKLEKKEQTKQKAIAEKQQQLECLQSELEELKND